ncbi:MAG: hypothetical protein DSY66_02045 [Persephonella sp.]|nr:MAG: hypothetical protein DSY53_03765 [Persephonella sp.]RUM61496.1 MAG: hypothetical protein DSY66_02045 [Persephonella sp.]
MNVENTFCLKQTFNFIKNNFVLFLIHSLILEVLILIIYILFKSNMFFLKLAFDLPIPEVVIFPLTGIETSLILLFLTFFFLLIIAIIKYIYDFLDYNNYSKEYREKLIKKLNFKNFSLKYYLKYSFLISLTFSLILSILLLFFSGFTILIYLILYTIFYIFTYNALDKTSSIFLLFFSSSFFILFLVLNFYTIFVIFRKLFIVRKINKILVELREILSSDFYRNTFTYEYFFYWSKWILTVLGILFFSFVIGRLIPNIIYNLPYGKLIHQLIVVYIYILALTFITVYTAICSYFSKEKLEFPYYLR